VNTKEQNGGQITEGTKLPLRLVVSLVICAITVTAVVASIKYDIAEMKALLREHVRNDWSVHDQANWISQLQNRNGTNLCVPTVKESSDLRP